MGDDQAAEDGAQAAAKVVTKSSGAVRDTTAEVAGAAAMAAVDAVNRDPNNEALAVKIASRDVASDIELEKFHLSSGASAVITLYAAALTAVVTYFAYKWLTQLSKYQIAAKKQEPDDSADVPGSVLMTNVGFIQM